MTIPYLQRKAKHAIGKAGRASETKLTKALGGRARPASGAMAGAKGDIDLGTILMEAKSTTNDSISLKLDWLIKIAIEARDIDKTPALTVSFVKADGSPQRDGQWVLVPMSLWKEKLS